MKSSGMWHRRRTSHPYRRQLPSRKPSGFESRRDAGLTPEPTDATSVTRFTRTERRGGEGPAMNVAWLNKRSSDSPRGEESRAECPKYSTTARKGFYRFHVAHGVRVRSVCLPSPAGIKPGRRSVVVNREEYR